jgi:RimJ/RimL family protein N-acetyltransferase
MERIETERLLLRPTQLTDVESLVALWVDPTVTQYMGGPRNGDELRRAFAEEARSGLQHEFDLMPVLEKATGRVVGHAGLSSKEVDGRAEVEVVYVFGPSAWGKGYATEAAQALRDYAFGRGGLARIIALVDPDNVASARVAAKAQLHYERDTRRPRGKIMAVYAASRTETMGPS